MSGVPPPVMEVTGLKKHFPIRKGLLRRAAGYVYAVDGVSFTVAEGETLGLVGESGCGKSTVARAVMRLVEPTSGSIRVDGTDITRLTKKELRPYRRQMQMIFQDPFSSLNPRMTAGAIVREPLLVHGVAHGRGLEERTAELFEQVGLRALWQRLTKEAPRYAKLLPEFPRLAHEALTRQGATPQQLEAILQELRQTNRLLHTLVILGLGFILGVVVARYVLLRILW